MYPIPTDVLNARSELALGNVDAVVAEVDTHDEIGRPWEYIQRLVEVGAASNWVRNLSATRRMPSYNVVLYMPPLCVQREQLVKQVAVEVNTALMSSSRALALGENIELSLVVTVS